jgi:hypothetical protein
VCSSGHYGRLQQHIGHPHDASLQQLTTFLDGRKVLANTADARGTKRFVDALSPALDRHVRRPLPVGPDPSLVPGP